MELGYKLDNGVFLDNRGTFAPLALDLLGKKWLQSNVSVNTTRGTFRGLHFQLGEFAQAKLVKVIHGMIIDFIVDIRPESPDYLKVQQFIVSPGEALMVPRGYAHGFLTTEDNTVVQYLVDNVYSPESEGSIYWNEFPEIRETIKEFFDGKLSTDDLIISHKDNYTKNFTFDK
jgi:dTDP-4-dehydrorhamnose 3,5-epimerase